jgi:hypothetical protein
MNIATKKMHLPLPADLHAALFEEARRSGVPATRLVRRALQSWLAEERRHREAEDIRRFAERFAGSAIDVDPGLEAASEEHLDETG